MVVPVMRRPAAQQPRQRFRNFTVIEPITAEAEASIRKDLPRPNARPLLVYKVALLVVLGSVAAGWIALLWLAHVDQSTNHSMDGGRSPIRRDKLDPSLQQLQGAIGAQKIPNTDLRSIPDQNIEQSPNIISKPTQKTTKKILTIYMERPSTLQGDSQPLPTRTTTADKLKKVEFPDLSPNCGKDTTAQLPVDNFPQDDPYLPWLHDYYVDDERVHFVAQNRRRCETGDGKDVVMQFWEPQVALFQPVPVDRLRINGTTAYRLAPSVQNATAPETRFLCHFHSDDDDHDDDGSDSEVTFSQFPFNYEYVLWRKRKLPMFKTEGPDVSTFELSQLLFSCPLPERMKDTENKLLVYLDLVPVRTPARFHRPLLTEAHMGPEEYRRMLQEEKYILFDTAQQFGSDHILPSIQDSGRWANLPICPPTAASSQAAQQQRRRQPESTTTKRRHQLVACTWTSAMYKRRGDAVAIHDSAARLKEWIVFHRLVGVDHIYIYDNTQVTTTNKNETVSPLRVIAELFDDFVTYISWPHAVCNNNRPMHQNPGERSSQYAADAACRTRYGPTTEWMTFIDTDEYIVPMRAEETWKELLKEMQEQHVDVLKMRSSRGRPRVEYTETMEDQSVCQNPTGRKSRLHEELCVGPRRNETFLRVYNCDYIRHPRPERFARAMKQIFRPANVLSHFVHYSTVTKDIARYYNNHSNSSHYRRNVLNSDFNDRFLDEITEGVLIHTKSVLPHETATRTATCFNASSHTCIMGHACPDSTEFDDASHTQNVFHDERGIFCNCWVDSHVESYWIPKLEKALAEYP